MNRPVEMSPDQPAWGGASNLDSAEAAQRDLLEFLTTSDAAAPPLAADAAPQTDFALPPDLAPPDFAQASHMAPSVAPDRRSVQIDRALAKPEMYSPPEPAHRDADAEACERAACSAAQAVDEATKENLRRLEATMSRLQNEVRALPRAPQIAPVRGVPTVQAQPQLSATSAFDAIIDRSSLHRTVHGATVQSTPPLPIWLCEHEAPIRLPPPRDSDGLWRRLVKFFWACTVAAPIAYVFAITTSPLHKPIADFTGLTSAFSSLLPMHDAQHAQLRGRELIAIASNAAPSAAVAASNTRQQAAVAMPSGVTVVASMAAEAGAAQAGAPPAEDVVASSNVDRASAPEAARPPPDLPVIAATEVGEAPPSAATAQADDSAAPAKQAAPQDMSALIAQGKAFFETGDLVAARILFRRAANAGDAAAATAMGATYDPVALAQRGLRGVAADPDKARTWYERAKDMGSTEGPRRLEMQANR
jgi:hypothetical protein